MNPLPGLTGLRFLAAFYVFIFHIHARTPFTFLPVKLQHIINLGPMGVNIFFVLSGFILTYVYHQKEVSYKEFFYKRLLRIYPNYFVGLLLCLGVSFWLNLQVSGLVVLADALMVESLIPSIAMKWYGDGAWSVSTEMFFYLLFPFLLALLLRVQHKTLLQALLVLVLLFSSGPGLLFEYGFLNFNLTYTFPLLRLPEFIAGMLLCLLMVQFKFRTNLVVGFVLFAFAILYIVYISPRFYGYVVNNVFILPAILALISLLTNYFKWVGSKLMVYLGQISYGFYIMQLPLMMALDVLLQQGKLSATDFYLGPLVFCINLLLAILVYELVEKPLQRNSKKIRPNTGSILMKVSQKSNI